jgi:hypothetical protein
VPGSRNALSLITELFLIQGAGDKGFSRRAQYIGAIDWREKYIKAETLKSFLSRWFLVSIK